jgi:hypothetical protein
MMNTATKILLTAFACTLPAISFAQSADAGYCMALSSKYQRYVASNDPHYRTPTPSANVSNAMASCQVDASRAIPVLEKALRDALVELPPHA